MAHSTLRPPSLEKVEPVFFRNSSVIMDETEEPRLKHYEVIEAVSRVVRTDRIDTVQIVRGLWRVYMKSRESRATLIARGIDIRNLHVQLYDTNPYRTKSTDPSEVIERLTFKDLPRSVDDSLIMDYVDTLPYEQKSKLQYARARSRTNQLTDIMTGDRYILLKGPIVPVLPNRVKIGQFTARVYHDSQFKVCKACGDLGHRFKDPECPAYDPELNALLFRGHKSALSNFFKVDGDFLHQGKLFDSSEKGFNWRKAMHFNEPRLAEEIRLAEHAGAAKALADKNLPADGEDPIWDELAPTVMQEVVKDKMDQCEFAKSYLLDTGDALLGEATGDLTWACGLWEDIAKVTRPRFWKGMNRLGKILMELRSMYRMQELGNKSDNESPTNSDWEHEAEQEWPKLQSTESPTSDISFEEAMRTVSDPEPSGKSCYEDATLSCTTDQIVGLADIQCIDEAPKEDSDTDISGISSEDEVDTYASQSKPAWLKSILNKTGLRTQTPPPSPKQRKLRKRKTSKSPSTMVQTKKPKSSSSPYNGDNTTLEEELEMMRMSTSVDEFADIPEPDPGDDWE